MKTTRLLFALCFSVLCAVFGSSYALGQSLTVGEAVGRGLFEVRSVGYLIILCFGLAGVFLMGTGLYSLVKSSSSGSSQRGYFDGIMRISLGSLVFSVPYVLGVGLETLWGRSSVGFVVSPPGVGSPRNCLVVGSGGLSCVVENLSNNVAPIVTFSVVVVGFILGLFIFGKSIYDLALSQAENRVGSNQSNVWLRMLVGVLLANLPFLSDSLLSSLGAQTFFGLDERGYIITSNLVYVNESYGFLASNFNNLVRNLFNLLVMFGVLAIFRGLLIFRQVAENRSSGRTFGSGVTHIVAGVLMMNMNWTICIATKTFLGSNFPFCGI